MHHFLVALDTTTRNKSGSPHSSWQMSFICSTWQTRLVYCAFTKALLLLHRFSWHDGWFFSPFPSVSAIDYLKQTAAHILCLSKIQKPKQLHRFGPTILNAFEEVAGYTAGSHHSNATSIRIDPQVAPLRVLPTPVPAPRMTLPPHLFNTTQHDNTVARKLFNPVHQATWEYIHTPGR